MISWIWDKLSWEKSVLVRSKILGVFVNTLTAEYKYSGRNMQNFQQQLQTKLSRKQKAFSGFFIAFLKCAVSWGHFEKKDEPSGASTPKVIDSTGSGYLNV